MKTFLDENFLLESPTAERLYHEYAREQPIIDYHNHLSPQEIAEDKHFSTITEVWLKGDHYKWRAMRANGIPETFITGAADDRKKFVKWAETVPYTLRNPLYHWTHLELQRYFGINDLLSATTAEAIYERTNIALASPGFTTNGLLTQMKVEVVCTTDHPTDDLAYHRLHAEAGRSLKMLPTFRPDKFLVIDGADFLPFLGKLETIIGTSINTFDQLLAALENRIDYFAAHGCQLADHGLGQLYPVDFGTVKLDDILAKAKNKSPLNSEEVAAFQMAALHELGKMYHQRNWTMQLHLGALRDNNQRLLKSIGADVGCDSIGDFDQARGLAAFLNRLDREDKLAKTILYNLNPRDNEVFATMAGNYNDGTLPGKIQWGSAWWFLDQKDGMEKQLNALSQLGLLSRFIGMLTDSRSFLSFPRHEYFRRILCNLLGDDVQRGMLPNDLPWLGGVVEDICYRNAKQFFDF
ncbi:glucuronate isomerase [Lewinella cohaerens]|uniref:glucuronate isomerase n=1 Tax=Lewinella cohaerens TaxID=70995 RepID=UPI00037D8800|nr:glucuronate isomerase [Lewinella cohaerens]